MRYRFNKSRAGRVVLGAVVAASMGGLGASFAHATLTLDLEAPGGTPNSQVKTYTVSGTGDVSLNVYADVTDAANSGTADGFGGLFASFDAVGAGGAAGTFTSSALSTVEPNNFDPNPPGAAQAGNIYSYTDSNGAVHSGIGNLVSGTTTPTPAFDSTTSDNWFFPAYLNNTANTLTAIDTNGTALANNAGAYFLLGTLTFNVSSISAGQSITVTPFARVQTQSTAPTAVWSENGTVMAPSLTGTGLGSYIAGGAVTLSMAGGGPQPHDGNTLPYDGHVVGLADFNNVLNNLGTTNPQGYAWPNTAANDLNPVGLSDFNLVLNNLGLGNVSPSVAVPEPGAFGILAIGGLALIRRRRVSR